MGSGTTWSSLLKKGTVLDAGDYLLVTGTRLASGRCAFPPYGIQYQSESTTRLELVMRESKDEVQVIGSFNSGISLYPASGGEILSKACWRPAAGDILSLESWESIRNLPIMRCVTLLLSRPVWRSGDARWYCFSRMRLNIKISSHEFPGLPSTIIYGIDTSGIAAQIAEAMKLRHKETLPVFIIADTFNRVVFF